MVIFLVLGIISEVSSQNKSVDQLANSIDKYIDIWSPILSSKYIKTPDGRDLKYTDFLKENINSSKGTDINLLKSLASFSSLIMTLSKNDAIEYGNAHNNSRSIRTDYQKYLYLNIASAASESSKIDIYINVLKSISFHIKVKDISIYKNIDKIIENLEIITSKNYEYETKLWFCNSAFTFIIADYAKTIVYGYLPDNKKEDYDNRLSALDNKKQVLNKQGNDESISIETLSEGEIKLIVKYFDVINDAIPIILNGENS